jgi:hypothetical protein
MAAGVRIGLGSSLLVVIGLLGCMSTETQRPSSQASAQPTISSEPATHSHPACRLVAGGAASPELPSPQGSRTPPSVDANGAWTISSVGPAPSGWATHRDTKGIEWVDGPGWLVLGIEGDGTAGLWTSTDGASWLPGTSPSPPVGYGFRVVDVVKGVVDGCPRLAALGERVEHVDDLWGSGGPSFMLVSDDGLNWQFSASIPPTAAQMVGVSATADGGFVAVGTTGSWPTQTGRVWTSADGLAWKEWAPPELAGIFPLGITTLDGILVATGVPERPSPPQEAWLSRDGVTWEAHEVLPPQSQGSILTMADAGAGVVVVVGVGENGTYAAESPDGKAWTIRLLSQQFSTPTGLDIRGGAVVVSGYENYGDGGSDNFIWVSDSRDGPWRSIPWRAHVPDNLEGELASVAFMDVALSGSRTAIVTDVGTVLLTNAALP